MSAESAGDRIAVRTILRALDEDPDRDGLQDTPERVMKSLREMTIGYRDDPTAILSRTFSESYDEMVVVREIEFWSLCEHHLLPFHGTATVGYVPNGCVVGLSKLARLVHCFARRLQIQERMTQEIAHAIADNLTPKGVGVIVQASHLCMAARGVKTPSTMLTSAMLGCMRDNAATRAEFMKLAIGSRA